MSGEKFYQCLVSIVGESNAALYASKFSKLDDVSYDKILNYEALAFYVYTTKMGWHSIINQELWSGNPNKNVNYFANTLNTALEKLVIYKSNGGLVYRGYNTEDIDSFSKKYPLGQSVKFLGFTSASFRASGAFGGNVLFIIKTLTGRAVWFLAADFKETEILMPSGRNFLVESKKMSKSKIVITLQEQL